MKLVPGQPVDRSLRGGEVHAYAVVLAPGQALDLLVTQSGADVIVEVEGPGEAAPARTDTAQTSLGAERVVLVAADGGLVRIAIRPSDEAAAPGDYRAVAAVRPASERDQRLAAANARAAAAAELRRREDEPSLRAAANLLVEALELWRAAADADGKRAALHSLAIVQDELGEKAAALSLLDRAVSLARQRGDLLGESLATVERARILDEIGRPAEALPEAEAALGMFRHLGDAAGEAQALNTTGSALDNAGDMDAALERYQESLDLCLRIGGRDCQASNLNNLGRILSRRGHPQEALEHYRQAVALWEARGRRQLAAFGRMNAGTVLESLGDYEGALAQYDPALKVQMAAGDVRGQAFTLHNRGSVFLNTGRFQQALDDFLAALARWEGLGDRAGAAATGNSISVLYTHLGDDRKSAEILERLLASFDPANRQRATLLHNLGQRYVGLDRLDDARRRFGEALSIWRQTQQPRGEAATLETLGGVEYKSGNPRGALDYYDRALTIQRGIGDRKGEATTLHAQARSWARLGDCERALELFAASLALKRVLGDRRGEAASLHQIASCRRSLGDLMGAREALDRALETIEFLRLNLGEATLRASFLASKREYYESYIDLLMELDAVAPGDGRMAEALRVSEISRARTLLDLLAISGAKIRRGVDPELLVAEDRLRQELSAKDRERARLLASGTVSEAAVAIDGEIEGLVGRLREIRSRIASRSPAYAGLVQPEPIQIEEIQDRLLDADTLLLEYVLGEKRGHLWAVTRDSFSTYSLPPRKEVERAARRLYELIPSSGTSLGRPAFEAAVDELSRLVLGPLEDLRGNRRLVVVADGALQYIPFALLTDPRSPEGRYVPLVQRHEVVHIPSATVLATLRRDSASRRPAPGRAAVVADPVFELRDPRVHSRIAAQRAASPTAAFSSAAPSPLARTLEELGSPPLVRLPSTRREAEVLVDLLGGEDLLVALDFAARRELLDGDRLGRYRILHFATHGLLHSRYPELSGLVLSLVDEDGTELDGLVRMHEIYNLDLPADLVVLSACRTALGEEIRGEGLVGLTRGFFYAGAAAVLASLWRVDDEATAALMERFYAQLLVNGLPPAAALRESQRSLIRDHPRWSAPYYWAGFVYQGDWRGRALDPPSVPSPSTSPAH